MASSVGVEGGNLQNNSTDSVHLIRLSAHAVARLDEVPERKFDSNDLPVRSKSAHHPPKHSAGNPFHKMAAFLTTRLHTLSYQECEVRLIETLDGLHLEVRATASGRMLYVAPLATLVDVSSDSVIEKDTVVFSQVPDCFSPGVENSSFVVPVGKKKKPSTLKKGEIISTLFRAYGEIGLSLTFKAPRETGGVLSAKPFTKVDLRFLSTEERNRWHTFCAEAYMGLLVDSIRTGTETHTSADQGPALRLPQLPPADVINSYVNFFLSAPGEFEGDHADADGVCVSQVPCAGLLRMGRPGADLQRRRVTLVEGGGETADARRGDTTLVFHRTSVTQRLKMVPHLQMKARDMRVYAENEQFGTTFFH
ncbi:hypothetical protein STCU_05951 [Strigomonas culicis]|uniref:Uncharacterized protein n=1 Tax=Strigomonas culicis TaxID=28005 RepID=S9VIU5_9TRYP|nr:hypothetical protein STCU_05951 [Strigomonas culicis]|eukprot:EPY27041.1 hypothetical protein STCU_05951 [Strigomonas culicis]